MFRIIKKYRRIIQVVLFFSYVIFVVWMTIIFREPRESERVLKLELFWAMRDFLRNSILGKQEVIQYVLNILFFVPIGFFFPWKDHLKYVGYIAMILSSFIELVQFIFNLGWCEIDDVISNTFGAFIGIFLYRIVEMIYRNRGKSRV